ncbi:MAG TPA: winged helix-turn-helix domain-containing protein [Allosphingosinicella sp.]|nr:winged helix-turn-helix domain-containing protein [Allosphingosinicella sp.]
MSLDPHRQLAGGGKTVPLGRKALDILSVLAKAGGATVTKDELLALVWPGVLVEENAIQVHVASLRKALGVEADRLTTIRGIGYRLDLGVGRCAGATGVAAGEMPSIAVLPLRIIGTGGRHAVIAEGLPHELIAQLSRLHWLFVIARGSSFQIRDPDPDMPTIGALLGARYCLSGTLEQVGDRIGITIELVDTHSAQVIWGDHYSSLAQGIHELRASIVASIITALEFQIPLHEAHRATLNSPEDLDAWALYHLALQRMFRFTQVDNDTARALFEQAVARDPHFARAHAGISFTRFQNAFMRYTGDTQAEATAARRSAERAIELDPADPFANLVFGRSMWVNGDVAGSLPWIDRALMLNPNYAQGAYAHAFADSILCHGEDGQRHADRAMALSPIDPMHYAMMGARALSHAVRGEYAEAARWSDSAARAPNSHVLIAMIAVACQALAGRELRARTWADAVRNRDPRVSRSDFFQAFPFENCNVETTFSQALASLGF